MKIIGKGKSYLLEQSAFYKLTSKNKLYELLYVKKEDITQLRTDFYYETFNKKNRAIQHPKKHSILNKVHVRIASLLSRLKTPIYLHSGIKKHSIHSNAHSHLKGKQVLTVDLHKYFPSVSKNKIYKFFKEILKTSEYIADILSDICTYEDKLPTGSQLSMSLAFWSNYLLFLELNRYAKNHNIVMTVYVDDITFSGKSINKEFLYQIEKIVKKHGYLLSKNKTRHYKDGTPRKITGIIINNGKMAAPNNKMLSCCKNIEDYNKSLDPTLKSRIQGNISYIQSIDPKVANKIRRKIIQ